MKFKKFTKKVHINILKKISVKVALKKINIKTQNLRTKAIERDCWTWPNDLLPLKPVNPDKKSHDGLWIEMNMRWNMK